MRTLLLKLLGVRCSLQEIISTCSMADILAIYGFSFVVGQLILHQEPFRLGIVHQVVLTFISILVIYMLRYCYMMGNKLSEASAGLKGFGKNDVTSRTMYSFIQQMRRCQQSVWCFVVPVFPAVRFVQKTLYLEYVPNSDTGYYAALFGASTFYLALIAYIHLAISIFFFWKISRNTGGCIPLRFPNDLFTPPEWLTLWASYFRRSEKAFFVSGALFTFEYILLMPEGIITYESGPVIHSKDPFAFITSWLTIVVLIIIAFPIIAILIRHLFQATLNNMRAGLQGEFQTLWNTAGERAQLTELWAYAQLSSSSLKLGSYIFPQKTYVPLISTLISLALNLMKLYESLIAPTMSGV